MTTSDVLVILGAWFALSVVTCALWSLLRRHEGN